MGAGEEGFEKDYEDPFTLNEEEENENNKDDW